MNKHANMFIAKNRDNVFISQDEAVIYAMLSTTCNALSHVL